ncbi:MAG TPA: hypothetical protein VJT85_00410 [Gemmatimonadaceae bacterium]|nr:hypothetical protein [Gemmatimonadaceae bacterium]
MPKLLVLFQSGHPDVVHLAETAAVGARSIRFAEVDVRRLVASDDANEVTVDSSGRVLRALGQVDEIGTYDGLILALGPDVGSGDALIRAIGAFGGPLENKVGAVLTPAAGTDRRAVLWSALGSMADRGMILVPAPFADEGASDAETTRRLGKRVAEVVGWVTHARSHHHHEHSHQDQNSHHHH